MTNLHTRGKLLGVTKCLDRALHPFKRATDPLKRGLHPLTNLHTRGNILDLGKQGVSTEPYTLSKKKNPFERAIDPLIRAP